MLLMMLDRSYPTWPPSDPLQVVARRLLRRLQKKSYAASSEGTMISDARIVLLRCGLDLYSDVGVMDRRGVLLRSAEPPYEAPTASPKQIAALLFGRARLRGAVRLLLACLWGSMARVSDWVGADDRRPVHAAEVSLIPPRQVEVLYRRTRPDIAGKGRRARFVLPMSLWVRLFRYHASVPPRRPLFDLGMARVLLAALRRARLCARSLRRGAVRHSLLAGASARRVQSLTGHQKVGTVMRYAGLLAPDLARRGASASAGLWKSTMKRPTVRVYV